MSLALPDKLYFKIGEVSRIAGIPSYVLRYWETEFREISPVKSKANQRLYRRRDVERVLRIKQLLYQDGFTIVGARQKIRKESRVGEGAATLSQLPISFSSRQAMQRLKGELADILELLERN